jgi:hypothetical protein
VGEVQEVDRGEEVKVVFKGQIKQLQSRILATGDKGGKLVIEFNLPDDMLIGDLAKLIKTDEEVKVTVEG